MSVALSTTKRKFHRILDSISNASSTTLASQKNASTSSLAVNSNTNAERPNKRARAASALAHSSPSRAQGVYSPARKSNLGEGRVASMDEERKRPNFAPWDRAQFLARLKTFRHVEQWMGKPDAINEVQWAKRGWSCVGKDRVKCVGGCGKEIVVKVEDEWKLDEEPRGEEEASEGNEDGQDWRNDAREELVLKYVEMIISGHDGGCLWRRRGCDDTVHRLPLAHQNTALTNLRLRYESLATISSELPSNISAPPSVDVAKLRDQATAFLISADPPSNTITTSSTPPEPQAPIDPSALILAAFGWQAEPSPIPGLASCTACFRRLGLWLFKPGATSPSSPTDPSPSPPAMARLDIVAEHREYCPWINAASQRNGNGGGVGDGGVGRSANAQLPSSTYLAGWELLLRSISNVHQSRRDAADFLSLSDHAVADSVVHDLHSPLASGTNVDHNHLDGAGAVAATATTIPDAQGSDIATRDEKDKERWVKLRRLTQVFQIKRNKGKNTVKQDPRKGLNSGIERQA